MDDRRIDFDQAIAAQPTWMARAAELAAEALGARPREPWVATETVAVVGMGASTHAGAVFVEALRQAGQRAVNLDASQVAHFPAGYRPADHLIVVSESGRSPEPIAAAGRLGVVPVVVTNDPASPLARRSETVVPLGGFTDSGVYTIGYTTTLVALAAIAAAHGVRVADPAALSQVATVGLAEDGPAAQAAARALADCTSLDLVGQGVSYGNAQAAALLLREAAGIPTAAYETWQYLHGPMESCRPTTGTLLFGQGREKAIADQLSQAGVSVFQLVKRPLDSYQSAISEAVFCQLLAADLARRSGRAVGQWRFPQSDTKLPSTTE